MPGVPNLLPVLVHALDEARIRFVIVGEHGLESWLQRPPTTRRVEAMVSSKQLERAVAVVGAARPDLERRGHLVRIRLSERTPDGGTIELSKPVEPPYFEIFQHSRKVSRDGLRYRVPSLEMALAITYGAMTSIYRTPAVSRQDADDFVRMVRRNPDYDRDVLAALGDRIYRRGGRSLLRRVGQAVAGEQMGLCFSGDPVV